MRVRCYFRGREVTHNLIPFLGVYLIDDQFAEVVTAALGGYIKLDGLIDAFKL